MVQGPPLPQVRTVGEGLEGQLFTATSEHVPLNEVQARPGVTELVQ